MNIGSISCVFPLCQKNVGDQTKLAIALKVNAIVAGIIAIVIGGLIVAGAPGFHLEAAYGWSILAVGIVLIVVGNISIKYIKGPVGSNNNVSSENVLDGKSKSNTAKDVFQKQHLKDEQLTPSSLIATSLHGKNTLQKLFANHLELLNSIKSYPSTISNVPDLIDLAQMDTEVMKGIIGTNIPFILIPLRCTSSREVVANRKYHSYIQKSLDELIEIFYERPIWVLLFWHEKRWKIHELDSPIVPTSFLRGWQNSMSSRAPILNAAFETEKLIVAEEQGLTLLIRAIQGEKSVSDLQGICWELFPTQ